MKKLLIATSNKGKLAEIKSVLEGVPFEIVSIADMPEIPTDFEVEETGTTFEENAAIKAKAYAQKSGLMALADDSGICVDALGGKPGVYSARYGETAEIRNQKLLEEMKGVLEEKRGARYVCAIAIYDPETEKLLECKGECEGLITEMPKGENGFGFDPIFFSTELGKTMAEAAAEEKNSVSHRGRALRKAKELLLKEY